MIGAIVAPHSLRYRSGGCFNEEFDSVLEGAKKVEKGFFGSHLYKDPNERVVT